MTDEAATPGDGEASSRAQSLHRGTSPSTLDHQTSTEPDPAVLICPFCHQQFDTRSEEKSGIHCEKCGNSFRVERLRPGPAINEIRVIGRFQLLERVGQGSFGTVWRAP